MTQEILGALQGENPAAEETGALPSVPSAQAACPPAPFSFSGPDPLCGAPAGGEGGDAPAQPAAPGEPAGASLRAHLDALCAQAEALCREVPDFDLDAALRDPDFLRLTAPGLGVPLRQAYFALHPEALERRGAAEAERQLARALAAGAARPREGGGRQGPSGFAADYRSLSRPEQLRFKQRILEAGARGEKLYP